MIFHIQNIQKPIVAYNLARATYSWAIHHIFYFYLFCIEY